MVALKAIWNGIKKFFTSIVFPNIIWTFVVNIPSFFVSIACAVSYIKQIATNSEGDIWCLIIIVVCTCICALTLLTNIIAAFYWVWQKKNTPFSAKLETKYKLSYSEVEMYFKDREHIVLKQKASFQVVADELENIRHVMQWSGEKFGETRMSKRTEQKGYRLNIDKHGSIVDVSVVFPEKKFKTFKDTYEIESDLGDPARNMNRSLSRLAKCETDKLCLKITAPTGMIKRCERLVSADSSCDFVLSKPEEVHPDSVAQYDYYRCDFENLDILRYYILRWEFDRSYE